MVTLKIQTHEKIAMIVLKFEQGGFNIRVVCVQNM